MKRREFLKAAAALFGCLAFGSAPLKGSTLKRAAGKDYYHILLISDLHLPLRDTKWQNKAVQEDVWQKKLQLIRTVNSWDVDEAALLGDFAAYTGCETEFRVVDEYLDSFNFPYYAVAGNHDYYYKDKPGAKGKLVKGTQKQRRAKLLAFQKRYRLPNLYYARSAAGCRLLYLAPDGLRTYADLSPAQLNWLKEEIAAHQEGPILFFCHAPLLGTLRNYNKSINTPNFTAQPPDVLTKMLFDVPQGSLWLSGHTHTPLTESSFADTNINRVNRNLVNIHNPCIDAPHIYTNSLFIYKDRILVRTYDHNAGKWLKGMDRTFASAGAE